MQFPVLFFYFYTALEEEKRIYFFAKEGRESNILALVLVRDSKPQQSATRLDKLISNLHTHFCVH